MVWHHILRCVVIHGGEAGYLYFLHLPYKSAITTQ